MKLRVLLSTTFILLIMVFLSSCGPDFAEAGGAIIEAEDAVKMMGSDGVVLVDTQAGNFYKMEHIEGAVNVSRADITVGKPYPNMVAPKAQVEKVFGEAGISKNSMVLIYDTNKNMDAARLWWTLAAYGHPKDKLKVISGGLTALVQAGANVGSDAVSLKKTDYRADDFDTSMVASLEEVKSQVDDPKGNVVIIDTRTIAEVNEGTIPASVHVNFEENNFADGTYRPVQQIRICYLESEVTPEKTIIPFCKTSIRAAQSYVALYNAGYRNIKIYDGAWVEWSSKTNLPVQKPEAGGQPVPTMQDGS